MRSFPLVPASFFGIALGLVGLGGGWRLAHRVWGLPAAIGEVLLALGVLVWAALVILYAAKWLLARDAALAEIAHPVQCCFAGLTGVATMLVAAALLPLSHAAAAVLYAVGAAVTLAFALWRSGQLWRGEREPGATTAILYLPAVAGSFVTGTGAAALGFADWGQLAFGAGLFSWLAIESVLLHRLYHGPTLPVPLRPTLGIQLAPPVVGAVCYLSVTAGPPDLLAHALLGYGLLQALLLLRLLPWILEQPFTPAYWAFSFGVTALANAALIMVGRGDAGAVATLARVLFLGSNIAIGLLVVGTLALLFRGGLKLERRPLSASSPAAGSTPAARP
ncbi:dicarboxylate transporter/tellurite-resistance protein TehA [Roseomonas sp. KE2513]|uniref:dicarboxylate transporter/tellurite-resistance protein TehA n=1 Tax=Roseomonas sp. KE2513 TaxID=2479202 RepID=UPI0018DFA6F6|nr:dicarboxylate transporter/tellurite-resistance protein TehA [Roseomonas sp. KE2513]MBI0538619.1 dicarboxylate transporter/tellurite-resistance protein TehA [Roseomonas sp. KE2513]